MKMGMMKIFLILLTFYYKLVLREGIFGTAGSLISYFAIQNYNRVTLCKQLLFQQTFFCFFFLFCQTRNVKKGCEEIFRQGKHVHNSRKL